jgi:predicted nucleotidyltransferase
MKPSITVQENRAVVRSVVECHCAGSARVFGSVLQGDDQKGRDLHMLIDPTPETSLFDIGAFRHDLLQLLGVQVDALTPERLAGPFPPQGHCRGPSEMTIPSRNVDQRFPGILAMHSELPPLIMSFLVRKRRLLT